VKFTAFFYAQIFETLHHISEQQNMIRTVYAIAISLILPATAFSQMFNPSASALPDGEINEPYTGQTINFTVPETTTISGLIVEQAIGLLFPQAAPVIGLLGLENQEFDFNVDNTTLIVNGLPSGLSATCDANPCTYIANSSGFITIEGTPTQSGNFTMNITTLSNGEADISSIAGGILGQFGIPTSIDLPAPVSTGLDETGYTLSVTNPNSIAEANDLFGLRLHPNPTSGDVVLAISSKETGTAECAIYSITGSLVNTRSVSINLGENRIQIATNPLAKGLYFLKLTLNDKQGVVRLERL
jgi:hypothetical protein